MIRGAEVEGALKRRHVCVISHHCTTASRTTHASSIVEVLQQRTQMGIKLTGRVDGLDEVVMGSAVTARQRASHRSFNYIQTR